MQKNVAIVGASDKPERYSNMALKMLREHHHQVFPVHPRLTSIDGISCVPSIDALHAAESKIDTVTLYVGSPISSKMRESLLALNPRRVIFNPGAENPELAKDLKAVGIEVVEACTLVMLRTDQF